MAPTNCKVCGRPVTKCVCSERDEEEEDDEVAHEGAGEVNEHGDDEWATPID